MTTYATFSEFTAVYSIPGITQAEINSTWLPRGAEELNSRLGAYFSLPFSSNNETARHLSIDLAYLGLLRRTLKPDDSEEMVAYLMGRLTAIACGNAPMVLTDGTALFVEAGGNQQFWSPTQEHKSVFDLRPAEEQRVSPGLLNDLRDQDT